MEAFVTLVATDSYASGALVIAHRLRELGSKKDRVCLVTTNVSPEVQSIISQVYKVVLVETLRSQSASNLELLGRPDLDITFTKIHAWKLTQYKKIVFLDADVFPLQNVDELFDRPSFSAAPDAGWPDCFNSGVFVAEPLDSVYNDLKKLASQEGSFDGGDQGLLNTFFSSWPESPSHRLPFTFNTTPTAQYGYAPAQVQYGHKVNIVHFIGQNKPWKYQRFADGKLLPMGNAWEGTQDMIQAWWNTWDKYFGKISPYHLLSGDASHFDSGFQTRPIVSFHEIIENAWENEKIDNSKKTINPMPPVSTITLSQPDWLQTELKQISEQDSKQFMKPFQKPRQHVSEEGYSMIQWDPAYEEPPNTGSLGADIPDLSSYKNVWDKPTHDQKQHIWVAPVLHPEPEIMKKPEYAHLIEQDRKEKEEEQQKIECKESISQIFEEVREHVQKEDHENLSYQNHDHHHRNHYPEIHNEISTTTSEEVEDYTPSPSVFPWESNPTHFPEPARIWLDEPHQHSEENYEDYYEEHHEEQETHSTIYEEQETHTTIYGDNSKGDFENVYNERTEEQEYSVQGDKPEHADHKHNNEIEVSDQYNTVGYISEEIAVEEKPYSKPKVDRAKIEKTIELPEPPKFNENASQFAIDEPLTPSVQSRIGEFIANLHHEEDYDFSDRDLIPINFKATSRLQSGAYTPSPITSRNVSRAGSRPGSRPGSRQGSRLGSRRSSVASSRRNSLPGGTQKRPEITVQPVVDFVQSAKLFASDKVSNSIQKTPYTSAAATPAYVASPTLENADYFNEDSFMDEDGFYQPSSYCLNDSLDLVYQTGSPKIWNPMDALTRLKSQSESMVLKQSLTEALNKAAKEQEELEKLEALGPAKQTFKSVWNTDEDDWPNLASGNSSPRTPIIRDMNSNLSLEIEHEKERYRQQRESLKITEPHNAVASLLEAELDLSSGSLFKRRNYDTKSPNSRPSPLKQPQIKKLQQESKTNVQPQVQESVEEFQPAYFSEDVIKEAQKRFNSLMYDQNTDQASEPLSFPGSASSTNQTSEKITRTYQPSNYTFESKSYLPNFGFSKQHKLKIHKTGLIEPEVLATMNDVSEIKNISLSTTKTTNEAELASEDKLVEKRNTSAKEESTEDYHTESQTMTLTDEGWVRVLHEKTHKASPDLQKVSVIEEMIVTDIENTEDVFKKLKESTSLEQTKEEAPILKETEIRRLDITKKENTMLEDQDKSPVIVKKETFAASQENLSLDSKKLPKSEIAFKLEDHAEKLKDENDDASKEARTQETEVVLEEIEEKLSAEKEKCEASKKYEGKPSMDTKNNEEIEDTNELLKQTEKDEEVEKTKDETTMQTNQDESVEKTEEELLREILENKEESEQPSLEIEEVDASDYSSNVHFGIEVFEVDSETQELVFQSEGIVETVEQEYLEIDEDEYEELEVPFYEQHIETLEIDEDDLEIESVDGELQLETVDLEEEETDTEVVVSTSQNVLEVNVNASDDKKESQEIHVHISVEERTTKTNEDSLNIENAEKENVPASTVDGTDKIEEEVSNDEGLKQETQVRYVPQHLEVETINIERDFSRTEEDQVAQEKITAQESETKGSPLTESQKIEIDVVEVRPRVSKMSLENDDSRSSSSRGSSRISISRSKSANLDAISEDSIAEFKALGSFLEKRSMSLEPMEVIHEFAEYDKSYVDNGSFTMQTTAEPQTIEYSNRIENASELPEISGSPNSYFPTRSISSTEASQSRPSMPTRKLSVTESILSSSRFSSSSITTTSVLAETFDKHGDTSSTKSDIMSRVRSYAHSKAPSTASLDTSSISSYTRLSSTDPKNTSSP